MLIVPTGCSAEPVTATSAVTNTPAPAVTAPVPCEQELVLPQVMEIEPAQANPGSEITVIGSGGYVQDSCGGNLESAREFGLYLDNEYVSDLTCYVNHCEGKLVLPDTLSVGLHCLSAEIDECQFEFQIAE
jgi:hypothetical protein